ncbi:MAG: uroporphyrinogen decarboxylase family protein [Bacteroidales bacterium]|jgi:uroporphyrinogen decarboxylase
MALLPRENLIRAARRQGFEWIPVDILLCDSQVEAFKKAFGDIDYMDWFEVDFRWVTLTEHPGYSDGRQLFTRENLPANTRIDVMGVGHSKGSEAAYHMTRMHYPLQGCESITEIEHYPLPFFTLEENQPLFDRVAALHQKGLAAMCSMQMTIWEAAWYIRSMPDLLMDMMLEDEKASLLLNRITDYAIRRVRLYVMAGVDLISLGDDIGMQSGPLMSVELWEHWIKPRLKRVIDAAREINPEVLVFYHSCGDATAFIEGLIECGVDILNPIQPECMDFNQVYQTYGDRLSFWGTLGTQQLLPFGTPEEVRELTLDRIRTCGIKGGLIIGPTHLVEPEVPFENLVAMKNAARELYPRN